MRGSVRTFLAYAVGCLVISISSILIYQAVTVVQVTAPPPVSVPVETPVVQPMPPGMVEPMELDEAKPAGRLLPMPQTGRE